MDESRTPNVPVPPAVASTGAAGHADLSGDLSVVVGSLHRQFDEQVGAGVVDAEVQQVADGFEGARIRAFVPLFVRRFTRERLRARVIGRHRGGPVDRR